MSLTESKMGASKGSLKDQLLQEERDLKAELEAVEADRVREAAKEKADKTPKEPKEAKEVKEKS